MCRLRLKTEEIKMHKVTFQILFLLAKESVDSFAIYPFQPTLSEIAIHFSTHLIWTTYSTKTVQYLSTHMFISIMQPG